MSKKFTKKQLKEMNKSVSAGSATDATDNADGLDGAFARSAKANASACNAKRRSVVNNKSTNSGCKSTLNMTKDR